MTHSSLFDAGALQVGSRHTTSVVHLQFQDFLQSDEKVAALEKLKENFFGYMLSKSALKPEHVIFSFKDHIVITKTIVAVEIGALFHCVI